MKTFIFIISVIIGFAISLNPTQYEIDTQIVHTKECLFINGFYGVEHDFLLEPTILDTTTLDSYVVKIVWFKGQDIEVTCKDYSILLDIEREPFLPIFVLNVADPLFR